MAYKTISGTVSIKDYEYMRRMIKKGTFTGPTDFIRNAIDCLKEKLATEQAIPQERGRT